MPESGNLAQIRYKSKLGTGPVILPSEVANMRISLTTKKWWKIRYHSYHDREFRGP